MKKRTTIPGIAILCLMLLGMSECGGGEAATEGEALTRSQKDSLVAEMPIPGAAVVGKALEASAAIDARNAQLDSIR